MLKSVSRFIKFCSLCEVSKPSNRKLGLYTPLPVPSRPWEIISMDFVGGLPFSKRGHDYLYVVVDRFSNMCILIPCKNKITVEQKLTYSFNMFGFILVFPPPLLVIEILDLLGTFGQVRGT